MKFSLIVLFTILINSKSNAQNCNGYSYIINSSSAEGNLCDFYRDLDRANRVFDNFNCKKIYSYTKNETTDCNKFSKKEWEKKLRWDYESGQIEPLLLTNNNEDFNSSALVRDIKKDQDDNNSLPMLLYFSDHGTRIEENFGDEYNPYLKLKTGISFGDDTLESDQYWAFINELKSQNKSAPIILIHDHCYSAGMLEGFIKGVNPETNSLEITDNVCGIATSSDKEYAYSEETMVRFMDQMKTLKHVNRDENKDGKISIQEFSYAHELEYRSTSIPFKTSDIYLKTYLDTFSDEANNFKPSANFEELQIMLSKESLIKENCETHIDDELSKLVQQVNNISIQYIIDRYFNFLKSNKSNYYRGAGFNKSNISWEEFTKEEGRINNNLEKAFNNISDLKKKYYDELMMNWDNDKKNQIRSLEKEMENDSYDADKYNQYTKLYDEYLQWVASNGATSDQIWTKYGSQIEEQRNIWNKSQINAAAFKRLKKTIDGLNGLALMKQRQDISGMENLIKILECEQNSLFSL